MDKIHLRIGSAKDNQLVVESVDVAPYHLELFCDSDGNVFITDLGSEQGTYVNSLRLDGFRLLKAGDKVKLGKSQVFNWERLMDQIQRSKKAEEKKPNVAPEVKSRSFQNESKAKAKINNPQNEALINKQLILIYGAIIFLLIVLSIYL